MGGVSRTLSYLHDANGNRTRVTHPDGQYFTQVYDGLDRLTTVQDTTSAGLANWTYDAKGRPESGTHGQVAIGFGYDPVSRLTSFSHDLAGTAHDIVSSFAYNPASQIVTRVRSNDAYAFMGNVNVNRNYAVNGLNQYTAAGPATFGYDANGNLTTDGSSSFVYDIENRLVSASGAKTATLVWDPLGRLFQTSGGTAGVTQFLYDGDRLVAEYDAAGTLLRRYVHGGGTDNPVIWYEGAGIAATARRSLQSDHQGSIVSVADNMGALHAVNGYDEYGIPNATNTGRFQYTGQAWIGELGMYHYKARIYSPTLGRFLQTDPIGYEDQINLYAYVGNDPVNARDPSGTQSCTTDTDDERTCPPAGNGDQEGSEVVVTATLPVRVAAPAAGTGVTSPQNADIVVTGQRQSDDADIIVIGIRLPALRFASNTQDPRFKGPFPAKPIPNEKLKTSTIDRTEELRRLQAEDEAKRVRERQRRPGKGRLGLLIDLLEYLGVF